jgi:hypothetical protein
MTMTKTTNLLAIPTLAIMLTGCGGPNEFTPSPGMSPADIFSSACQECHGEKGSGKFGFLLKIAGSDEVEEMNDKIKNGGHIMPSFPNIGDADRAALVDYVKSL